MPSEKDAARRGGVEDGRRIITACCARVPQRCTSRTYMRFLLMFQEVIAIRKTRNQLSLKNSMRAAPAGDATRIFLALWGVTDAGADRHDAFAWGGPNTRTAR